MDNKFSKHAAPINLAGLGSYSDKISLSQVVLFFGRLGVTFTKTMIQNYVRVGLLPPLIEKRYYGKKHIVFLALISSLKDIYSLDEIKSIFGILKNIDDQLVQELYSTYITLHHDTLENFKNTINLIEKSVEQPYKNLPDLQSFVSALLISTIGTAAKSAVLETCCE